MALEIGAGIRDQSEAGGVRLGKSVERERSNRKDDLLLRFRRDAVTLHTRAKFDLDIAHAHLAALEAEGAAQFLGFATTEAGGNHRHAQELLLKERHPQRAFQYWLQRGMRIDNGLPSLPASQKRVNHLADDGPRTDDCDLYHNVVEARGMQARQARHLRPALDLEHAHRVGLL